MAIVVLKINQVLLIVVPVINGDFFNSSVLNSHGTGVI